MENYDHLKDRGLTLIELLVILVVIGVIAGLLLTAVVGPGGHSPTRVTACACHLSQLFKMTLVYKAQHGHFPAARGSEYWLALWKTDPPLIERELQDLLFCPMRGDDPRPGATDYRGPAFPAGQYTDNDPIGADLSDNHDEEYGINVIRPAGDVQRVYRNDPQWAACDAKLAR